MPLVLGCFAITGVVVLGAFFCRVVRTPSMALPIAVFEPVDAPKNVIVGKGHQPPFGKLLSVESEGRNRTRIRRVICTGPRVLYHGLRLSPDKLIRQLPEIDRLCDAIFTRQCPLTCDLLLLILTKTRGKR